MKQISRLLFITLSLAVAPAFAEVKQAVPKTLLLQAVVQDDGGNVISSEIQEANFTFRIRDGLGEILFTETQNLVIYNGMISALVGRDTEGGLPLEALAPDSDRILEFQMDGHSISQETLLLASSPYAYYADSLTGGVDSLDINDGEIKLEDLSDEVKAILSEAGVEEGDLEPVDATEVSFEQALANGTGSTVSAVLVSIDSVISTQGKQLQDVATQVEVLETSVSDINNIPGVLSESKIDSSVARDSEVTTALANYVKKTGDTMTGPLTATVFTGSGAGLTTLSGTQISTGTVADARIASTITRDTELSAHESDKSTHGVTGNIVGTSDSQTLTNKTLGSGTEASADIEMDGNEIKNIGTRGYSVGSKLENHEDRIGDLEKNDTPAGMPLVLASVRVNAQSDTPELYADSAYNVDSIERSPVYDIDSDGTDETTDDCTYKIDLSSGAVSGDTSYAVIGTLIDSEGDNGVIVRIANSSTVVVATVDMGDEGSCSRRSDFSITLIGY